jgi:hypothetical protein
VKLEADHSPPSTAEVKNGAGIPQSLMRLCGAQGQLYIYHCCERGHRSGVVD